MTIDILDKVLLYVKSESKFVDPLDNQPYLNEEEKKYIGRALLHLEKDGFLYSETKHDEKGNKSIRFYITFEGLLALENAPLISKNKPYKWKKIKGIINTIWEIAKIIIIVLNALVILYLMMLTVPN